MTPGVILSNWGVKNTGNGEWPYGIVFGESEKVIYALANNDNQETFVARIITDPTLLPYPDFVSILTVTSSGDTIPHIESLVFNKTQSIVVTASSFLSNELHFNYLVFEGNATVT